jgi:hypothetical protein
MNADSKPTFDRAAEYDRLLKHNPQAKLPLFCRVYRDPQGQPFKTKLAEALPLLSRSDRRKIMRQLVKDEKKVHTCKPTQSQSAAASSTA